MTEVEFNESIDALYKKNPQRARKVFALHKKDPKNSWENLMAQTEDDIFAKKPEYTISLDALFGENKNKVLNPESEYYFANLPYEVIKDRAIKAGYVMPLGPKASEEDKQKQRKQIGDVYNYLAAQSTSYQQGKSNPYDEYYGDFRDDVANFVNKNLMRNTTKLMTDRAKEGKSPTQAELNVALPGDFITNVLLGMGAAGGIPGVIAAGTAGINDAFVRDNVTDDDVGAADYLSDAAWNAVTDGVAAPIVMKQGADAIKRVGGGLKKGKIKDAAEMLEDVSLKASGQDIDIAKYGKEGKALLAALTLAKDPGTAIATQYINEDKLEFQPKDIEIQFKDLQKRKPLGIQRVLQYMSDFDLPREQQLTSAEIELVNKWKTNRLKLGED